MASRCGVLRGFVRRGGIRNFRLTLSRVVNSVNRGLRNCTVILGGVRSSVTKVGSRRGQLTSHHGTVRDGLTHVGRGVTSTLLAIRNGQIGARGFAFDFHGSASMRVRGSTTVPPRFVGIRGAVDHSRLTGTLGTKRRVRNTRLIRGRLLDVQ